jgi:hypothetical protein
MVLCAEHADTVTQIIANHDSEEAYYEGRYDATEHFHTLHPNEVIEAHGMKS